VVRKKKKKKTKEGNSETTSEGMRRALDAKPKPEPEPNVVSFTQCGGSSSTLSASRVCGHSQLCDSSRHLLLRLCFFNAILERCVPTLARWIAGWLAGWPAAAFGWQGAAL
jgi:hypothetical protein